MGFAIVDPEVERYLDDIAPASDPVLREMEAEAARRDFPIVGPHVGRLLYILARIAGAREVLELGSGFGYSGIWFARALAAGGRVVMTEGDPDNVAAARSYFERAGLSDKAVFEQGEALATIARYDGPFDIVFCDIDKHDYPRGLELALPRLKSGGLLITDNVLWSGRVARPAETDPDTSAIREYNRRLFGSSELVAAVLPLRDGVAVAVKR